jgi:hypothetical protein
MLYLIVVSLLLSLNVALCTLCLWSYIVCCYSSCAFSLLVMNIVVTSCWLSRGDVESSVLLLLHARTHLKHKKKKKKKKLHLYIRMVVLTRNSIADRVDGCVYGNHG